MNQIAFAEQHPIHGVGCLSAHLTHPESIGSRADAGDLHLPCREIDEEQNQKTLQTSPRPDFHAEEIGRYNQAPVLRQKLLPTCLSAALRRRFDTMPPQNLGNRAHREFESHMRKCTLDTSISPGAILLSHAHYLALDFFSDLRSTRSAPGRAIILFCNQFAVP